MGIVASARARPRARGLNTRYQIQQNPHRWGVWGEDQKKPHFRKTPTPGLRAGFLRSEHLPGNFGSNLALPGSLASLASPAWPRNSARIRLYAQVQRGAGRIGAQISVPRAAAGRIREQLRAAESRRMRPLCPLTPAAGGSAASGAVRPVSAPLRSVHTISQFAVWPTEFDKRATRPGMSWTTLARAANPGQGGQSDQSPQ